MSTDPSTIAAARRAIADRDKLPAAARTRTTTNAVRAFAAEHKARPTGPRVVALALTVLDLTRLEVLGAEAILNQRRRSEAAQVAGRARAAAVNYDVPTIRKWARSKGLEVPDRGRYLPPHVVQAYRHAHPHVTTRGGK